MSLSLYIYIYMFFIFLFFSQNLLALFSRRVDYTPSSSIIEKCVVRKGLSVVPECQTD